MTSRRNFLRQGTLGSMAAGLSLGLSEKVAVHAASAGSPLGLNMAAFASQLHTTFLITDGTKKIPLKLIEVMNRGSRNTLSQQREAFTLVLRGSSSAPLNQETYSIEHERLGGFSFMLVPVVSRDNGARYYEININRLHG